MDTAPARVDRRFVLASLFFSRTRGSEILDTSISGRRSHFFLGPICFANQNLPTPHRTLHRRIRVPNKNILVPPLLPVA